MIAAVLDTMAATCPTYATTRRGMPFDTSNSAHERAAFTHALYCPTCRPLADQHRQEQADRIATLAVQADAEQRQAAVPVLHDTIKTLEANGFYRHYLWDTAQAKRGIPVEECRVDIAGALAVALFGLPAWYDRAQPDTADAVALLHRTVSCLMEAPPPV